MTAQAAGPRATCPDHTRYRAGCDDCLDANRAWTAWRYPPVESDGRWGLRWTGDFGGRSRHEAVVLNEQIARSRAAWWRGYRPEVQVEVIVRDGPGSPWTVVKEGVTA